MDFMQNKLVLLFLIIIIFTSIIEAKTKFIPGVEGGVLIYIGDYPRYPVGGRLGFEINKYITFNMDIRFVLAAYPPLLMFGLSSDFHFCGEKLHIVSPYLSFSSIYGLSWGGENVEGVWHGGFCQLGGGMDITPSRSPVRPFFEIGTLIYQWWTVYPSIIIQGGVKFTLL